MPRGIPNATAKPVNIERLLASLNPEEIGRQRAIRSVEIEIDDCKTEFAKRLAALVAHPGLAALLPRDRQAPQAPHPGRGPGGDRMSAIGHQFDFGCGHGTGLDSMGRGPDWEPAVAKPREPTPAPPGSADKIEVLAARYVAGEPFWHPLDERWPVKLRDDFVEKYERFAEWAERSGGFKIY